MIISICSYVTAIQRCYRRRCNLFIKYGISQVCHAATDSNLYCAVYKSIVYRLLWAPMMGTARGSIMDR